MLDAEAINATGRVARHIAMPDGTEIPTWKNEINGMVLRYRFLSSIEFCEDGCWRWRKSKNQKGYGAFWDGFKNRRAHRWAYEHFVECLPASLVLDHLCRNHDCVNPYHVEPVTQQTNVLRGECPAAQQARKTHCKRGHLLAGDNLFRTKRQSRQCKICDRNRKAEKRSDG